MNDAAPTTNIEPRPSSRRDEAGRTVLEWYSRLQESRYAGARARLRRARNRAECLAEPMAIELARRLMGRPDLEGNQRRVQAAVDISRVLAHVKRHDGRRRFMQQLGWPSFPGSQADSDRGEARPVLAEVRFRRLLLTMPGDEMVATMVRLVRQLEGVVNVDSLTKDMLGWYDERRRDDVKQQWSLDYFAAGQPAPAGATTN